MAVGVYFGFIKKTGNTPDDSNGLTQQSSEQPQDDPTKITMFATGDWIAHDAINAQAKQADGSYAYESMVEGMKPVFETGDINFCNLATLAGGQDFGVSGYPTFNAPTSWIDAMDGLGCNVYNTGSNHTNDKGQRTITAELDYLDTKDPLAHAGANRNDQEQKEVKYFTVKGVNFALVSYSTYWNIENANPYSLNHFDETLVVPQLNEAREKADVVIVSMRWGTEYSEEINAKQDEQAQYLANLGADIVLGHGTHTLQPVKELEGKDGRKTIVWYGLGNFLNAQLETTGLTGCVAQLNIDVATKKITSNMCLPFYMHYEWTAEEKAAENLLARKNFRIMPLYSAADMMAKSQLDTTVDAQMNRISEIVNKFTDVQVVNATDL